MLTRSAARKERFQLPEDFQEHIRIQASSVGVGLGAFTLVKIPRNTVVGYYRGRPIEQAKRDRGYQDTYIFDLETGPIDAYESSGLFHTAQGVLSQKQVSRMSQEDLNQLNAVWHGTHSQWTRFLNHSTKKRYINLEAQRSADPKYKIQFKTTCTIPAGAELFFDYGKPYWSCLTYKPKEPGANLACKKVKVHRRVFLVATFNDTRTASLANSNNSPIQAAA